MASGSSAGRGFTDSPDTRAAVTCCRRIAPLANQPLLRPHLPPPAAQRPLWPDGSGAFQFLPPPSPPAPAASFRAASQTNFCETNRTTHNRPCNTLRRKPAAPRPPLAPARSRPRKLRNEPKNTQASRHQAIGPAPRPRQRTSAFRRSRRPRRTRTLTRSCPAPLLCHAPRPPQWPEGTTPQRPNPPPRRRPMETAVRTLTLARLSHPAPQ